MLPYFPEKFTAYYEPFCGAASVFAALHNKGRLKNIPSTLGDMNGGMMALLEIVRSYPDLLIEDMKALETRYYTEDPQKLYYEIRDEWNRTRLRGHPAHFFFLKQTAFNGLWRTNAQGDFNASWGKYPSPKLVDEEQIMEWHAALQDTALYCRDAFTKHHVPRGGLVLLDPPYLGTFDGYTAEGFSFSQHVELLRMAWEWGQRGVSVGYCNSVLSEGLVRVAWPDATIVRFSTSYTVNCDGAGRAPREELFAFQIAR